MNEKTELDGTTSATLRTGIRGHGGHQKIKISGLKNQADTDKLAQVFINAPGIVAVKIFAKRGELQYNQEFEISTAEIAALVETAGFKFLKKVEKS